MPEIIRSLVVVLAIASFVFYFARKYATDFGLDAKQLPLRIRAWYVVTCAAFLAHNFWLFAAIAGFTLWQTAKKDTNPLAMVMLVLFAVPLFGMQVPGFGIINYVIELSYFRLIGLCVLLPMALQIRRKPYAKLGSNWLDRFVLAYVLYGLVLVIPYHAMTNLSRLFVYSWLDVLLPYFVASRVLRSPQQLDDTLRMFVLASVVLGLIGVVEYLKGWLLYSSVPYALGIKSWGYGGYLLRGSELRASASTGQAIVLGYIMAVALGLFFYMLQSMRNHKLGYSVLLLLLAGLYAPISRGPWVGAAVMVMVYIAAARIPLRQIAGKAVLLLVLSIGVLFTPLGSKIVDKLPFVGTVDAGTIDFRQRLIDNALDVIARNPWFGSRDYLQTDELESMRAGGGEGIIDVVNSYIAIALSGGLVGLGLFLGAFVVALYALRPRRFLPPMHAALLAAVIGTMVTIFTVSSITFIPVVYYFLLAFACAVYKVVKYD